MTKWTVMLNYKRFYRFVTVLFIITVALRLMLLNIYMPDFGGIDMNVIYGIQRLIAGEALYQNPGQPTYAIIQYTPLYYHVVAAGARLLSIHTTDVQSIYALTRSFALLFNLLTVGVAASIIRLFGFSARHALVFAMPVLMVLTTHYYLRGDSLHLLCFVAAVYYGIRYAQTPRIFSLLMSAVFSGCCLMAKQSGILCIGIIGFYLLFIERKWLMAMLYGVLSLAAALLVLKLCIGNNWSGFYQNAYLGLKNGIGLDFLYTIFISQFYYDLIPCYFLGALMVYAAIKYNTGKQYLFVATGAGLSFLFAVITGLKVGSSNNYFTEFLVFVLIALPFFLEQGFTEKVLFRIRNYPVTIRRYAFIAFLILVSSKTVGFFTSMYIERRLVSQPEEYRHEQMLFNYFKEVLKLRKGEYVYFNERNFLDNLFIGYSVMPTKDVISQVYLTDHNTYDYQDFTKRMNAGMVKYIVASAEKHNINEFEKEIPFIHFDPARFQWIAEIEGFSIYIFSDL